MNIQVPSYVQYPISGVGYCIGLPILLCALSPQINILRHTVLLLMNYVSNLEAT